MQDNFYDSYARIIGKHCFSNHLNLHDINNLEWYSMLILKKTIPLILWYKVHLSRQLICRSLRCSWSIACRRCSNYIFILNLTPDFKDWSKTTSRRDENHLSFGIWCILYQIFDLFWQAICLLPLKSMERWVNSLWPHDMSAQDHAMACCLTTPSHYLNQYKFLNSEVLGTHLRVISLWVSQFILNFVHGVQKLYF